MRRGDMIKKETIVSTLAGNFERVFREMHLDLVIGVFGAYGILRDKTGLAFGGALDKRGAISRIQKLCLYHVVLDRIAHGARRFLFVDLSKEKTVVEGALERLFDRTVTAGQRARKTKCVGTKGCRNQDQGNQGNFAHGNSPL